MLLAIILFFVWIIGAGLVIYTAWSVPDVHMKVDVKCWYTVGGLIWPVMLLFLLGTTTVHYLRLGVRGGIIHPLRTYFIQRQK